jgi:hypothetical protein
MSLVKQYNSICPCEDHKHRIASKLEYTNNKLYKLKSCFLCDPKIRKNIVLNYECNLYEEIIVVTLPKISRHILINIFSGLYNKNTKYFIPTELQDIIIEYCSYKKKINKIKYINEDSINHMANCNICSKKLLNFTTLNACSHHNIPRNYIN